MRIRANTRSLIALLLAALLIAATLPASATPPVTAEDGPMLVDLPHDDHSHRCCLSASGGHLPCHASAALAEGLPTRGLPPAARLLRLADTPLSTRSLPPLLKPPTRDL